MVDIEWQRTRDASSMHKRGVNWDTRADRYILFKSISNILLVNFTFNCNVVLFRSLSETVKTLKNQMTDLQSQMSLLTKQLDEERRSRLSLAATVKRSMAAMDSSIS